MHPWLRSRPALASGLVFAATVFAKPDKALERMVPVPATEPIPVADFFKPPVFRDPQLNPAGTHYAAIVPTLDDNNDLVVFKLGSDKEERLGSKNRDVYSFDWLNDKRILFQVSQHKRYVAGLYAVDVGRSAHSYAIQQNSVVEIVGFPKSNDQQALVWILASAELDGADEGVMKIETQRTIGNGNGIVRGAAEAGILTEIVAHYDKPKDGTAVAYLADLNGELAFCLTTNEDGFPALHRLVDGKWQRCAVDMDDLDIVGPGGKPGELLVVGPRQDGKPRGLHRLDAVSGQLGELLYQDAHYDFSGRIYRHPVDRRILGVQYERQGPQTVWFDPTYAARQAALERALPNHAVRIIGSDREEKHFFVSASSDVSPTSYHHIKPGGKSVSLIANVAPWIDPARMRPMQLLTFKSRDRVPIEGYLTLPEGASKEKPAPLIVLPHGGPWRRDNWGWDPEVQFLASRGYAVFQPNYRGSKGSEWRFPEEDIWNFTKMHEDVTDGVKALLRSGLVDRDRVAIMGGSFGAYLALCGAVDEPELYRCAVAIAGVFDWETMMKERRSGDHARNGYGTLRRFLGDPRESREKFDAISPIRRVHRMKAPIFVAHGKEDRVAEVQQAQRLLAELKKHGIAFEKHLASLEGHGFQRFENRVELYTRIEAFLAKHMAPRPASAEPAKP
jgi:acetyl esterase/lipase